MEFNPSKCQVLHISKSRHPVSTQYSLHNQALESVGGAKYLGVHLSKDLSWNTHVSNITSTAYKTIGFVKRNVNTTNQSVRELAYKTLVRPQFEYASNVWSPSTKVNIDKIEMTQRRAARWVKSNYSSYDSVTEMLHDLGWRSLEQRRLDARLIMFYKIVYGLVAIQLPSSIEHPMKITRHMHSLSYRQIHTAANYYQFSFFPMSIVLWNRLPEDVVKLSDLDSF